MVSKLRYLFIAGLLVSCVYAQDTPINQQLKEFDEKSSKNVPPALLEAGRKGTEELAAAGIVKKALNAGAQMPEFTLNDTFNKPVKSSDLLKQGHLIVVFYRGAW